MRKMKDSGIEWIGEIPEEWNTVRLRSRFSFGKGLPITKADLAESGIGVISYGQIHSKTNIGTTVKPELIRYVDNKYMDTNESSLVHEGEFIFADTSEDISGCGNCVYVDVDYPVFAGYHTMILRPENKIPTKYFSYLFATDAWRSQIRAQASGVKLYSITQKMLRDTLLIEPSGEEKENIANYLDKKCAEIDALIAAKEKTNALLKEQRQSIIYEAVTKGLAPDVPMKDSGIEWIGEIPENWETKKLKFLVDLRTDKTVDKTVPAPYVGLEHVMSLAGTLTEDYEAVFDFAGDTIDFKEGDVLFGKLRPYLAKAIQTETNGRCSSEFWVMEPKLINGRFLLYLVLSHGFISCIDQSTFGVKMPRAEWEYAGNRKLALPDNDTQKKIADYLDKKCAEIDTVIATNNETIQKLKEYRQSIIYESVTGKIEV